MVSHELCPQCGEILYTVNSKSDIYECLNKNCPSNNVNMRTISKSMVKRLNIQSGKELDHICPDCGNTGMIHAGYAGEWPKVHAYCTCLIGKAMEDKANGD